MVFVNATQLMVLVFLQKQDVHQIVLKVNITTQQLSYVLIATNNILIVEVVTVMVASLAEEVFSTILILQEMDLQHVFVSVLQVLVE